MRPNTPAATAITTRTETHAANGDNEPQAPPRETVAVQLDADTIRKLRAMIRETGTTMTAEELIAEDIESLTRQYGFLAETVLGIADDFTGEELAQRRALNKRLAAIAGDEGEDMEAAHAAEGRAVG